MNHRIGILTAVAVYYYFGPAAESEGLTRTAYANRILATFVYNDFMAALKQAGLTNIHTIFGNTGGATQPNPALGDYDPYPVSLQRRTITPLASPSQRFRIIRRYRIVRRYCLMGAFQFVAFWLLPYGQRI